MEKNIKQAKDHTGLYRQQKKNKKKKYFTKGTYKCVLIISYSRVIICNIKIINNMSAIRTGIYDT